MLHWIFFQAISTFDINWNEKKTNVLQRLSWNRYNSSWMQASIIYIFIYIYTKRAHLMQFIHSFHTPMISKLHSILLYGMRHNIAIHFWIRNNILIYNVSSISDNTFKHFWCIFHLFHIEFFDEFNINELKVTCNADSTKFIILFIN